MAAKSNCPRAKRGVGVGVGDVPSHFFFAIVRVPAPPSPMLEVETVEPARTLPLLPLPPLHPHLQYSQ